MSTQYKFNDIEIPNVDEVSMPSSTKLGVAENPMRHGGFFGRRFFASRKVQLSGVYLPTPGQDFDDLQLAYQLFISSLANAGEARLFVMKNWFFNAVYENVGEGKRDFGSIEFDLNFHCADPRMYKLGTDPDGGNDTESSSAVTHGSSFTIDDGVDSPVILELVASGGYTATLEIEPVYETPATVTDEPLIWTPGATGTTLVYMDKQYAERGGVDVTSEFEGNFFGFPAGQQMHINFDPSAGSNITVTRRWRQAII